MKLHIRNFLKLAALIVAGCMALGLPGIIVWLLPTAHAEEMEKYVGKVYSFGELPGFAFSDKKKRTPRPVYFQLLFTKEKFFLLAEENKQQHSVVVVDVAAIPQGLTFIGRPMEDECERTGFPEETIFVVGKWRTRKTSTGVFSGGYAYPITQAWRVNFDKKIFEKIPISGIRCEDNRTDADVD